MSKDVDLTGGLPVAPVGDSVRRGREYLRVSFDRSGRECSTTEQHAENERAADRRGVELVPPPYVDQSISASRYSTKARDDFLRLIEELTEDRFGADELWLWESSRGSRRVGEWVELIDLCEKQGVKIYVTTHDRVYDPANPRDRRSLLEDAVDSEYESAKISMRAKRPRMRRSQRLARPLHRPNQPDEQDRQVGIAVALTEPNPTETIPGEHTRQRRLGPRTGHHMSGVSATSRRRAAPVERCITTTYVSSARFSAGVLWPLCLRRPMRDGGFR